MQERPGGRIIPIAAISGAVLVAFGTFLHPMDADPNIPSDAFTEYAADDLWVASHLIVLLGFIFIAAAFVLISRRMADGAAAQWATLGMTGAVASLVMLSALQAVDGIALKVMVDSWAVAAEPERTALFQAAFAVRQIEIALASIAHLLFGLTVAIYGVAFLVDPRFPRWIGALAVVAAVPTVIAGIVLAYTGFSGLHMWISMPSSALLLLWMIVLGVYAWRRPVFEYRPSVSSAN